MVLYQELRCLRRKCVPILLKQHERGNANSENTDLILISISSIVTGISITLSLISFWKSSSVGAGDEESRGGDLAISESVSSFIDVFLRKVK